MVHPRDGEGHSQILHRNYLLPIGNNLEQVGDENSVAGFEPFEKTTPVLPVDSALLANRLPEIDQKACLTHCQNSMYWQPRVEWISYLRHGE